MVPDISITSWKRDIGNARARTLLDGCPCVYRHSCATRTAAGHSSACVPSPSQPATSAHLRTHPARFPTAQRLYHARRKRPATRDARHTALGALVCALGVTLPLNVSALSTDTLQREVRSPCLSLFIYLVLLDGHPSPLVGGWPLVHLVGWLHAHGRPGHTRTPAGMRMSRCICAVTDGIVEEDLCA
jgi:hypothetical protein